MIKLICNYFYYSGVSPSPNTGVSIPKPLDSTIRARRLMKEYKEIQKIQTARPDPIFTVCLKVSFLFVKKHMLKIFLYRLN